MGKNRTGVPPLRPIRQNPKPRTPLQQQFAEQKKNGLQHATQTTPLIRQYLLTEGPSQTDEVPSNSTGMDAGREDEADWEMLNQDFDGESNPDNELVEPGERAEPEPPINPDYNELEPLFEAMADARYQAARLQEHTRWASQYNQMLPTFLRCCLWTSNWSSPTLWNKDYKPPCDCPQSMISERIVDLVDTQSESQVPPSTDTSVY